MGERTGKVRDIGIEPPIGRGRLFVAVFGAAIAWSLHLLVSYLLIAVFCNTGWPGLRAALVAATLLSAAGAAVSGVVAYRAWRRWVDGQAWDAALHDPRGRATGFLLVMGMVAAGLFLLSILLGGVPPFLLPGCGPGVQVAAAAA